MRIFSVQMRSIIGECCLYSGHSTMNVLYLTLLVSLCLAGIFTAAFVLEHVFHRGGNPERDALLPLDDGKKAAPQNSPEDDSKSPD
ncbi:MAG: hypothetical protein ACK5NG_10930 [Chthoniobacterales bacterium]